MIHHGDTETRSKWRRAQKLRVMFVLYTVALASWAQPPTKAAKPIDVRELVDEGSKGTERLVVVQGCMVREFEISVLQPCDVKFDQFSKYSVWLDDILHITLEEKQEKPGSFIPAQSQDILKNGRGNLWKLQGNRDQLHMIVVEGEFQTEARRKFGHLNFYKSRFIVHRFLEANDTKK